MSYDWRDETKRTADKPFCTTTPPSNAQLWNVMRAYLTDRGLSYNIAVINGWYPSWNAGDDSPRVVIPCVTSDPNNRYWQGRLLIDDGEKRLRYTSPSGKRGDAIVVVHPHGMFKALECAGTVFVEGCMDALAAAGEGYRGIATMGTFPPEEALDLAARSAKAPFGAVADEGALAEMVGIWMRLPGTTKLAVPYPDKDLAEKHPAERGAFLRALFKED